MPQSSCSICGKDFLKNDELKRTKCDHIFHSQCVNFWVDRMKKCAKCEKSLTHQDIFDKSPEGTTNSSDECDDVDETNTQDEIINELLAQLRKKNRRKKRTPRRPSRIEEERRPRIENRDGTVIECDVFRPMQFNFGLQNGSAMPFMGMGATPGNQLKY